MVHEARQTTPVAAQEPLPCRRSDNLHRKLAHAEAFQVFINSTPQTAVTSPELYRYCPTVNLDVKDTTSDFTRFNSFNPNNDLTKSNRPGPMLKQIVSIY